MAKTKSNPNPNLYRRRGPIVILVILYPWAQLFLWFCRFAFYRSDSKKFLRTPLTVFQSYQVGDFFMALPAIRRMADCSSIQVLCRPDCAFLLRQLGIEALPLQNPLFVKPGPRTFLQTLVNVLPLRKRLGPVVVDFHADPRTAFLLKVAGVRKVHSYQRPYGWFMDSTFVLPKEKLHQSEKDMAVAEEFVPKNHAVTARVLEQKLSENGSGNMLMLSCWTRKDEKNWPLEYWQTLLDALLLAGRTLCIIVPPDCDRDFNAFQKRNQGSVEFLQTELDGIYARMRNAAGIMCTDNFLGHMGAYLGKPVFWINGSSDSDQVRPYGIGTEIVQLNPMPCRPCRHRCTNPVYKQCLVQLTPEVVISRAEIWINGIFPSRTPLSD